MIRTDSRTFTKTTSRASQESETELMRRVARGDSQAFEELYTQHAPCLRAFLMRRLGRLEIVDEVLNDVMWALWLHAARFDPQQRLLPWLWSIARHKASTAQWRDNRRLAQPLVTLDDDEPRNPEAHLMRGEHAHAITQALLRLPTSLRTLVTWAYYEDASYQDMAQRLDCSVETVKARLRQARRHLGALLRQAERLT